MFPNNSLFMIILLLLPFNAITENYGRFFEGISNGICQNPSSCSFLITTNFPTSPKIPTRLPTQAILGSYKYIYLLFDIPKDQKQKQFFLEAYDISNGETIITNGDCYFINTTKNTDYEIRIYRPLKDNSFIQFGFLGLLDNFSMLVRIRFKLSTYLYFNDIALSFDNAIYKGNEESLKNYIDKNNKAIVKQKERRDMAIEIIKIIMKKFFMFDIASTADHAQRETVYKNSCILSHFGIIDLLKIFIPVQISPKNIVVTPLIKFCLNISR